MLQSSDDRIRRDEDYEDIQSDENYDCSLDDVIEEFERTVQIIPSEMITTIFMVQNNTFGFQTLLRSARSSWNSSKQIDPDCENEYIREMVDYLLNGFKELMFRVSVTFRSDLKLPFGAKQREPLASYLQHYQNKAKEFTAKCGHSKIGKIREAGRTVCEIYLGQRSAVCRMTNSIKKKNKSFDRLK
ncbi:hypothetical protein EG68_00502 [Paragonimus skrjabini miyazakii]|uniref:Uncharacterized protein n=1 Tax=Paragonimus skrjabini miyazakii TaxID=59628 RepID=A0A8S9Z409_9TREM|nr:hypothetical protein EG68_00502 [Paragonimus skrjabini miyazakii]